ncbi:ketoacyl-ACP synthase III [Jiangella ureilytica]|uniref:Ketoacyl-ACP synthase III n=1 Tax=Jiangella ureilytica TaxID=2530374 RepID=A0A4R4RV31_9ACTN|nr:ketoacyl-ACP synthase III [Jiangella ureilytica]TDC53978.1 ketoacyl-ACP synthase III [Jiangella ureilytica]
MAATPQPVGILGTGSCLPAREVPNAEVAALAGVAPEWIEKKTQIRTRRYAAPEQATSDLAAEAGRNALEDAGVDAAQLDYLLVATSTPDSPQPPTAALVQDLLGARGAACLDLNAVCSGFVYALAVARGLLAAHPGARALVIAADVYSRILDAGDRRTAVLFADGAGAVVVGGVPDGRGVLGVGLHTRGDAHQLIRVPAGGSRLPASSATVAAGQHWFAMDGHAVSDFVLDEVPPAIDALLTGAGVERALVDHFVPHQPNGNLLDDLVAKSGLDGARTHRTLERYGNVGSACIPVALDEANRAGRIADGDLVLLAGFGGGMAIGTCLLRWSA